MQQQLIDFFTFLLAQMGIGEPMVGNVLGTFVFLFGELMVLFILISFFVGLLQSYIAREKIQKALTTKYRFLNSVLGAVLGSVTPFCSCSTIPLLVGLRKSGAPFAGMVSFLLTSPILNPMIVIVFFSFFGFVPTLMYSGIALVFAIVVGYILDRLGFERYFKDNMVAGYEENAGCGCGEPTTKLQAVSTAQNVSCCKNASPSAEVGVSVSCCAAPTVGTACACSAPAAEVSCDCSSSICEESACCEVLESTTAADASCGCSSESEAGGCCGAPDMSYKNQTGNFWQKNAKVWSYSFKDALSQFRKILLYLLIGAGIGSFIYGFVPAEFLVQVAGEQNPFAVPIAAVLGVPMYIRTEAVLPLANLLIGQGVGLGTMVALIIGGAGASIPEVSLLSTLFKKQFIITFLICIFTVAVISGYAFNFFL